MILNVFISVLFTSEIIYGLPFSHSECQHERQTYKEGQEIRLADPCVKCSCSRGSVVCRLRVCAAQPLPPPRGCWLVTRKDECCQKLVCAEEIGLGSARSGASISLTEEDLRDDTSTLDPSTTTTSLPSTGCTVNGRFYPEGEMVTNATKNCEHCYCLKGKIRCEPVVCTLPVDAGCTPILTPGHCCPTSYNCNPIEAEEKSSAVPENIKEESWRLELSKSEIFSHQNVYSERSMTNTLTSNSENKSTMAMTEATKTLANSTKTLNTTHKSTTTTQSAIPTTFLTTLAITNPTTQADIDTTEFTATTDLTITESYTLTVTTDEPTTTDATTMSNSIFNDTEERMVSNIDSDVTTLKGENEVEETTQDETTFITTISDRIDLENKDNVQKKSSNISDPLNLISSDLEALLNSSHTKDEDYGDALPPSLPNLRIIPFVAADAVVDKPEDLSYTVAQEKSHPTDSPHFYEVLHSNRFSPPAETEGGFLPREPLLEGPFYESKYDPPYHTTGINHISVDITSETKLPSITEQPKIHKEERCSSGGQSYSHGELLTEPNACELCLCFYGEIICQEPKCPPVKPGCHQLLEKEHGTCCGKIVCGSNLESPTRVVDHATPLPGLHPVPHLPAFTVAHDVTPDPFRDVIRTEPAPDLPALIGEIMPYLWDHSTSIIPQSYSSIQPLTTPISITTETINDTSSIETSTAITLSTSTEAELVQTNLTAVTENVTRKANISEKTTNITYINKTTTWDPFSWMEEEETTKNPDYDDSDSQNGDDTFSLQSVFNYIFNNEPITTSTTLKPNLKNKKPVRVNTTLLDIKVMNKTFSPNTINIKNGNEEPLENRSDDNVNLVLNFASTSERPSSVAPGYGYPDDTKVINISDFEKPTKVSTNKSTLLEAINISHTTVKYFSSKTSTRKHFGTKYSSFPTRRPLLSKPTQHQNVPPLSVPDPGAASGLLKLAGCNIYGRMYRVGRIISELSGPCLECMCTEVGVQCRPLKC